MEDEGGKVTTLKKEGLRRQTKINEGRNQDVDNERKEIRGRRIKDPEADHIKKGKCLRKNASKEGKPRRLTPLKKQKKADRPEEQHQGRKKTMIRLQRRIDDIKTDPGE